MDQNLKSKMECLLASNFDGFWKVLGGNLGVLDLAKWLPRGCQKIRFLEGLIQIVDARIFFNIGINEMKKNIKFFTKKIN